MTRKVDDKHLFSVCEDGARIATVSEVNDQTETLEGYPSEKAARPDLG